MGHIIGIDFGAAKSCVAVMKAGRLEVIVNSEGERTTPSVVAWSKNGEWLIGQLAKRQAVMNADNKGKKFCRQCGSALSGVSVMLYCPQCNKAFENGKKFCKHCGSALVHGV